jgi:hypothetical protein
LQTLYLAAELQLQEITRKFGTEVFGISKNLRAKLWLMNEAIVNPPTPLTSPQKLFVHESASSGSLVKKRPLE